jgi:superfamily II DNA or RNA helicase
MLSVLDKIAKVHTSISMDVKVMVGNIFTKIHGKIDRITLNKIDDKLSWWMHGAQFTRAYQQDIWDGRIRLFRRNTQIFPTGFLDDVLSILNNRKIFYKIKDIRKASKVSKRTIEKAIRSHPIIKPRSYQIKAVEAAISKKSGIINIPTGTGKTLIINLVIKALDIYSCGTFEFLIISSGISLLSQLQVEISRFQKTRVGFIGEGKWNPKRITVASIDTLYKNISDIHKLKKRRTAAIKDKIQRKKDTESLLSSAKVIFCDEAHHSPAKIFKRVIYKTHNASFRIGTTATYKRSGGDDMMLRAVTGDIIFKRSLSWMISKGYLAIPTILLMEYGEHINLEEDDHWSGTYSSGISKNVSRNIAIAKIASIFNKYNLSTILFVTKVEQGRSIKDFAISRYGIPESKLEFLHGRHSQDIRKPVLKNFQQGNIRTLICTKILNEGMDFPECNAGIRAGAQKFEGGIIQQLGRILRKYKNPIARDIDRKKPQRVFWIDLCDLHNKRLAKHSLDRIKTYESEEAFDVRYVSSFKEIRSILDATIKDVKIIKNKKNTSD